MALEVSLDRFKNFAVFDLWFSLWVQPIKKVTKSFFASLLLIILFPIVLIVAQFVPFIFGRHIRVIIPHLPNIKDTKTLLWIKDVFTLYYYSLKGYEKFCLFRKRINTLLDEVDEQIDSLEFALSNWNEIQQVVTSIDSEK